MITTVINLNKMGKSLLGDMYDENIDYIMLLVKEREYIYKKYLLMNKTTKKYILFFVQIMGTILDSREKQRPMPIFINDKKIIHPLIDKPNMVPDFYTKTALMLLDSDTLKYLKDIEIQNIYSNSPLIIKDNSFTINPSIIYKENIFITPTIPPQNEKINKFISSTVSAMQDKHLNFLEEFIDKTNIDCLLFDQEEKLDDYRTHSKRFIDLNYLIDIELLLNIISNPNDIMEDIMNMVDINLHYKYFIEGDLVKININNDINLNIDIYHCDYFDAYLYYMNELNKGEK